MTDTLSEMVATTEAAYLAGVSLPTLRKYRAAGRLTVHYVTPRCPLYRRAEVVALRAELEAKRGA